jgi:hypothetical protein
VCNRSSPAIVVAVMLVALLASPGAVRSPGWSRPHDGGARHDRRLDEAAAYDAAACRAARVAVMFLAVLSGADDLRPLSASALDSDSVAIDFWQFYRAAETILDGNTPYLPAGEPLTAWGGPYPYPPLPALVAIPFTALPLQTAGLVVMAMLIVGRACNSVRARRPRLALLRDPARLAAHCLRDPDGNVTLWFGLAAALTWRYRDRLFPVAASIGITLAAKFFLWPLVVWLAFTRRVLAAAAALVVGTVVLLLSWAVIGFSGFLDYPELLRKLEHTVGGDSYTAYIVGLDLGLPSSVSRALWVGIGLAVLSAVVVIARRGDERTAFIVAIAASLALTPIVWLHYFALLLVAVALARPRLGPLWFVPFGMFLTAWERSADTVPDFVDAPRRSRDVRACDSCVARGVLRSGASDRATRRAGDRMTSSVTTDGGVAPARTDSAARAVVRERAWTIAVWGAMAGWSALLFTIVRGSYVNFREGRFDLGNMVQAVWSTAHGHPLEVTQVSTGEQLVRLGGHVDPFLALLAPLWIAWPSPLVLGLAQVVIVALGALPVFWLGRRHLGSETAAGSSRSRTSLSVDGDERRSLDPSGDVRDPVLPLSASGSSTPIGSFRSPCSRRSRCPRASSWGSRSPRSASGTRSQEARRWRVRRSPASAWRGPRLRSPSSSRLLGRRQRLLRVLRRGGWVAGRCRQEALHRSRGSSSPP